MRNSTIASLCGLLVVFSLAGGACSREPPAADDTPLGAEDGWQGSVVERGDAVHVRNPETALWEGTSPAPIRFEPDAVFGGSESQLESIGAAMVDANANVYVYDPTRSELIGFDPGGSVLWRAGEAGSGEGEFEGVRGATYDGEATLWLVNQNGARLDAWSTDGTFQRAVLVDDFGLGTVFMGGFLPPDRIALLVDDVYAAAANEYVVVDLSDTPAVQSRFRVAAEPMTPIPPGVVMQLSHHFDRDRIFVGTWGNYVLRAYDDAGTLRRHVSRPVDYLRGPGFALRGEQYAGIVFGGLAAPIVLQTGHWLVLASWPTNVPNSNAYVELPAAERPPIAWASSLDLFDAEGRFLYSVQTPGSPTPEIGRPWAVGPRGRLYTVSNAPFPQVRRYRVILTPPSNP